VAGVHGDELRMVRGVTVQHPVPFIGGQRRFVARKSQPANCARRRWHNDVVEFRGRQDDSTCSGAWLRHGLRRVVLLVGRARGRRRAAALSLSARGVLSSTAATYPSLAARRLLGARSTCTTRCVDGASKAEKAVADNLQAPTRMLLAGMEVGSRRRGVSKGE